MYWTLSCSLPVLRRGVRSVLWAGGLQFFNSAGRHGRCHEHERSLQLFRCPHGSLQCLQGVRIIKYHIVKCNSQFLGSYRLCANWIISRYSCPFTMKSLKNSHISFTNCIAISLTVRISFCVHMWVSNNSRTAEWIIM